MLASMTKSSASIFIIAFICTEILINSSNFSFKKFIIEISKRLMPIVLGVFFVMLYQKIQGADSWFSFINAQKLWGKEFSLPKIPFSDWSNEGRSITFPFVYIFLIPMIIILIRDFIKGIKHKENTPNTYLYVKYLSMFYVVGNILVAILTQKGSLNSLARYIFCNPFFVFLLFQTTIQNRNKKWQYIYCAIAFIAIFLCRNSLTNYNGFGIYLFILTSTLVFFHRYLSNKAIYVLLFITIALNILWTAYLLNAYLSDSWIYT
jgi:NADH:ubiquinone oxidoreductase subunit K